MKRMKMDTCQKKDNKGKAITNKLKSSNKDAKNEADRLTNPKPWRGMQIVQDLRKNAGPMRRAEK